MYLEKIIREKVYNHNFFTKTLYIEKYMYSFYRDT